MYMSHTYTVQARMSASLPRSRIVVGTDRSRHCVSGKDKGGPSKGGFLNNRLCS